MQGILIGKNRAKLSKLRNDVVITQNKLREAGPQAKNAADNCDAGDKLRWNGTTWSCLRESDHYMNVFAKDPLPVCALGWVLTTTSTTSLGCTKPDKGPIGPAPTWRKPNGGNNLQIANPNGTWGSNVYLKGDGGDKYTWYTGAYGSCSESCGPGTRTRVVECRKNMYTPVADGNCAAPKPTTTTSCNLGSCVTYSWTAWEVKCDEYTETTYKERSCIRDDTGATVACSKCGGLCEDPWHEGITCYPGGGDESFTCTNWRWGMCFNGFEVYSGQCVDLTGEPVDRYNCPDGCMGEPRPCGGGGGLPSSYSWDYGNWSSCSSSCTQTRSATCKDSSGNTVPSSNCSGTPNTSQSCTGGSCGDGGGGCGSPYSWKWGSWSTCSSSCTQTRYTRCADSCNDTVSSSNCSGSGPATSQSCTGGNCVSTPDYTYSWSYGSWSGCSSSCTQTRSASCRRSDGATVSSSYCSGSANTSQSCTGGSCSQGCTFTYIDGGNVNVPDGSSITSYQGYGGYKGNFCLMQQRTHTCNNGTISNGSVGYANCQDCGSYDPMWCEENVWNR